jgi:MoaA/NifB/PqqE/SkfB family radical SAM enzyme
MNILLHSISAYLQKPWTLGLPTALVVEPSSVCNLRCPLCPSGLKHTVRKPPLLELETFKLLIDEIGDVLNFAQFFEWGEPFLNPAIFDMIKYAKTRDIVVLSSTNGLCFPDEKSAGKLVASGLDCIVFAIDGTTQEVYEKYRAGGRLQDALDGLARVIEAKKADGGNGPIIHLRMVVNAFNEHQVEDFKALGRKMGVDLISVKTMDPGMCEVAKDLSFLPGNKRFRRDIQKLGLSDETCKKPWCTPTLYSDGSIVLCGMDALGKEALGKISPDVTFKKLWHSQKAKDFRKNIIEDANHYSFCRSCGCRVPDFAMRVSDLVWINS